MVTLDPTMLLAAVVSFLLLALAHHWLLQLTAGRLHQLWRYVAGQVLILATYAVWCRAQPGPLSAASAVAGLVATVLGAGAGTMAGYAVDAWLSMRRRLRYQDKGHESQTSTAGTD